MTLNSETIFVTEDGDAGPQQALIPSLSIANLLHQREAVMKLFQEALETLQQAHEIADHARLGFPDLSMARDWRGHGIHMTGLDANHTTMLERFQATVDAGGWTTLLQDSGIRSLMSAEKRSEVDKAIHAEEVPPLTRAARCSNTASLNVSAACHGITKPICHKSLGSGWWSPLSRPMAAPTTNSATNWMTYCACFICAMAGRKPIIDAVVTGSLMRPCGPHRSGRSSRRTSTFRSHSTKTKADI